MFANFVRTRRLLRGGRMREVSEIAWARDGLSNDIHMTIRRMINLLIADLCAQGERGAIGRSTATTAGLQIAITMISFGSSLLYARVMGPHDFGLYAYVTAWTALLTVPVSLGMQSYLVREGAVRSGIQRKLRRWADARVLIAGTLAGCLLIAASFVPAAGQARMLFLIASPIPLLAALGQVRQGLLCSLKLVATSQWPLMFGPLLMALTMLGLWQWQTSLDPWEVTLAALAAVALILVIGHVQLNRVTTSDPAAPLPPLHLRAALPFMVMGVLFLVHDRADIVLLGMLRGPHDTGVYAIVARGSATVAFLAATVDMVVAPRFAAMHRNGDLAAMQKLLTSAARRVFLLSLPLAIFFLIAAHPLLRFLYGAPYGDGATALRILTIGYLSILFTGSTTSLANMTGHERLTLYSVITSVVANILLNLVLIPIYGMNGSAVATALSFFLYNGMQWAWVRTRLGLRPGVIGF